MTDFAHALLQEDQPYSPQNLTTAGKMGRLLMESGKIKTTDLENIISFQKKHQLKFGEAAVTLGLVTPEDIRKALAQQFSYPAIPAANSKLDPSLVAAFQPESRTAEALRGLRSELILRYFNNGEHLSLPLVGTEDSLSLARTTANLAIVFAQMGLQTLLIDSNMRDPKLHTLFGIHNCPGLSDIIAGRTGFSTQVIDTFPTLSLLHAGTLAPNPQELLSGNSYRSYMEKITRAYDVTLICTSPIDQYMDAQLVAAQAGAALLVVKEHQTRIKALEKVCNRLHSVDVRLLGVALTA